MGLCDGQVVVVTGAGRGIGRAHALAFAAQGARVVVNDLGTTYKGEGRDHGPAEAVVKEILAGGGEALANAGDITDEEAARQLVHDAIESFGDLHTVVNNAGILRTKPLADMTAADMNASWAVHVLGPFHLMRAASDHWRQRAQQGDSLNASVINTTSAAGLWPGPTPGIDQSRLTAYGTVKAAVAALTLAASAELFPLGIRVNAIAPGGRTRMNTDAIEDLGAVGVPPPPEEGFDLMDPSNVSPLVVWLSTPEAAGISGRVFESGFGQVGVANGWTHGPSESRTDRSWDPAELGDVVRKLLTEAPSPATMMGN
jgi:NAD(P)-dependent dehydrogenase (short-subunit alcohol dehydrogenase family)